MYDSTTRIDTTTLSSKNKYDTNTRSTILVVECGIEELVSESVVRRSINCGPVVYGTYVGLRNLLRTHCILNFSNLRNDQSCGIFDTFSIRRRIILCHPC